MPSFPTGIVGHYAAEVHHDRASRGSHRPDLQEPLDIGDRLDDRRGHDRDQREPEHLADHVDHSFSVVSRRTMSRTVRTACGTASRTGGDNSMPPPTSCGWHATTSVRAGRAPIWSSSAKTSSG